MTTAPEWGTLVAWLRTTAPELVRIDEDVWEIPAEARADMRVPARVFADWS